MSAPDKSILARRCLPNPAGRRIGLFGGSFNPAHNGHRQIALTALKALQLDQIWWLVAPQNPLKDPRDIDDFSERLALTKIMANHPRFVVCDAEKYLGTKTTAETLQKLSPILNQGQFVWIMGADSFASLHRWHHWREIPARLPLAVMDRPGFALKAISSPAGRILAKYRLPRRQKTALADKNTPAWVFLSLPLRHESSTAIRQARKS